MSKSGEFRVVGVAKSACKRQAEKAVRKTPPAKTPEQWQQRVEEMTQTLFEGKARPMSLAEYDVPKAALEFAQMARAQPEHFRDVAVEEYRKTGEVNPKTGKPVGYWAPLSVYPGQGYE